MKEKFANDLFDIIKVLALPKNQNDDYADLSRKHAKQAGDNIKKLLKNRNISLEVNKITIGAIKPLILTINQN